MPTNQYGVTEFDADPETAAELIRLKRQQSIADEMMKQGQQNIQGQMVGGVYVKPSITQGIAQLFNAYSGRKASEGVEEGYKGLADRKAQETAAAIDNYKRGTMGVPEQPMGPPTEQGQMGVQPAITPSPEQRRQAIIEAAISSNPRLSKMGQLDFQTDMKKEDRAIAFQDKLDVIREQARLGQISKQEADARSAELRKDLQENQFAQQKSMAQLAAGLRQPAAPTMTEVVDPSDPNRMLRVDAKSYKGGTVGSQGVLGISGKEPSFAKKAEKEGQGKELLATELENMKQHYVNLKDLGGMPSSEQGGLSNAMSWVQSSGAGQLGGRILGTKEQDERNSIKATRLRLLNAIKNATGMTAQQMNSNVELKTWLDSLGDPTQSYESNMSIIGSIEDAFLKGGKGSAKVSSFASEAEASAAGLKPGTPVVINGVKGTWQ